LRTAINDDRWNTQRDALRRVNQVAPTLACSHACLELAVSETFPSAEPFDMRAFLRTIALFGPLDAAAIDDLAGELQWIALAGGAALFAEDDPADALYILRSGSLGAYRSSGKGHPRLLGMVNVGETVGEVGLIAQLPRTALVRALRDSELLRLPEAGFRRLVTKYPDAMMHSMGVAMRRHLLPNDDRRYSRPRTFAILPHDAGVDGQAFARSLKATLERYGNCALIDAANARGQDSEWFNAIEMRHRFVLYVGEAGQPEWREQCARQADCFVLPVHAATAPSAWPEADFIGGEREYLRPRHLVLMHAGDIRWGCARGWLGEVRGAQHHHVRGSGDIERISRLLTGRSIGLVLSGGGARGFAHIGVVRALREAGQQIDCVGGTSIGAIIGAGVAADWSHEEMLENYRRAFVDGYPLRDYTFPFVSLTRGMRVSRLLRREFDTRDIEDLALPFYCVTANLTAGHAHVHRSGPLWLWLRAGCAIPGVLPPVFHHGEVYVDGAVINNLPVDPMRERQVGEIVAVDIGADEVLRAGVEEYALPAAWRLALQRLRGRPLRPGILGILLRAGMVNSEAASIERRAQTSLLLTPPVHNVGLLDWHAYERAIDAGYRYASEILGRGGVMRELP
jgi:NTE family protein